MGRVSWEADGFFLRVVRVGSSASGCAAGAGRPGASSTFFLRHPSVALALGSHIKVGEM